MHDRRALVFDVVEAGGSGDGASLGRNDAELEPERPGLRGHSLFGDSWTELRAAEDVHEVDRLVDLGQRGYARDAEHLAYERANGNHAVAGAEEVAHDSIAGAARLW